MLRVANKKLITFSASSLLAILVSASSYAEDLGADMANSPGAALSSWSSNRLDVWATGVDHVMYHRAWSPSGWTNWDNIGGSTYSKPAAVSWGSGRIDVFGLNSSGSVMHRAYDVNQGGWDATWDNILGGSGFLDIAVDSQGSGLLDVFVIQADGRVRFRQFSLATGWTPTWTAPTTQDDKVLMPSLSATSWGWGRIDILAHTALSGVNSAHNTATVNGFGSLWDQIPGYDCYQNGGVPPRRCALTARGSGSLVAFTGIVGISTQYSIYTSGSGWSAWQTWGNLKVAPIAAVSRSATQTDVLAIDYTNELYHFVL
jgi:hypothetical protein